MTATRLIAWEAAPAGRAARYARLGVEMMRVPWRPEVGPERAAKRGGAR